MLIHGREYTEVKDRIPLLLKEHPEASITTDLFWHNDDCSKVVFKATIKVEEKMFTGWSYEERVEKGTEVNSTSWVENAETSAIGRALANMNIGVSTQRPSAEEMQKVERMKPPEGKPEADVTSEQDVLAKAESAIRRMKHPAELEKAWARAKELCDKGQITLGGFTHLEKIIGERTKSLG